jgi:hypothetical protein
MVMATKSASLRAGIIIQILGKDVKLFIVGVVGFNS